MNFEQLEKIVRKESAVTPKLLLKAYDLGTYYIVLLKFSSYSYNFWAIVKDEEFILRGETGPDYESLIEDLEEMKKEVPIKVLQTWRSVATGTKYLVTGVIQDLVGLLDLNEKTAKTVHKSTLRKSYEYVGDVTKMTLSGSGGSLYID